MCKRFLGLEKKGPKRLLQKGKVLKQTVPSANLKLGNALRLLAMSFFNLALVFLSKLSPSASTMGTCHGVWKICVFMNTLSKSGTPSAPHSP